MGELSMVRMGGGGGVKAGTYTGNGASSQTINLGVTPKWVAVWGEDGAQWNSNGAWYGGLALQGSPCQKTGTMGYAIVKIVENGFEVYNNNSEYIRTNSGSTVFHYLYGI